ncbi:MAG TPA: histidine phosphatase family protein [Bacteroidia bacterium]|nr:histidine phosphatase family protein [Bacteroidia bacterium]
MKTLLLARHGTAEERREGENDFDRTLTEAGKKESAIAGKKLLSMNLIPEIIISSPAPRAFETAKIISGKIKYPKEKIRIEKVLYTGNVQQALKLLSQIPGTKQIVILCGHNPLLEEIFSSLCEGRVKEIHKGDIAAVSFEMDDWRNVKGNTGINNLIVPQDKNSKQRSMKTNKTKNQKKELQAQVAELITAFAKSKTKIGSKKIRKTVKEASKLLAKAIYKTLNALPIAKKQTVKKKIVKRKTVKKVTGIKAKPVVKKIPAKKLKQAKSVSKNILPSMNNISEKVSAVESNPLHA